VTRAAEADPAVRTALPAPSAAALPPRFSAAMDNDLSVPLALAVVHEAVTEGNTALAAGDAAGATKQAADVRAMMAVLGLDPLDEQWSGPGADEGLRPVVSALVSVALEQRQEARERKDYAAADAIRDRLKAAGITVEDTARGVPRWDLRRTDDDA
jgi:cysteinyl-tRNA synthetase